MHAYVVRRGTSLSIELDQRTDYHYSYYYLVVHYFDPAALFTRVWYVALPLDSVIHADIHFAGAGPLMYVSPLVPAPINVDH